MKTLSMKIWDHNLKSFSVFCIFKSLSMKKWDFSFNSSSMKFDILISIPWVEIGDEDLKYLSMKKWDLNLKAFEWKKLRWESKILK